MTENFIAYDKVVFFDDFIGNELDRTKWNVEITGEIYNKEQQAYIDSEKTIYFLPEYESSQGVLVIHPRYHKGFETTQKQKLDFLSGRINTRSKFEFQEGCVSARIKVPRGEGLWPAFWALGSSGKWPGCGEIDIMEYVGESDWTCASVHGPGYSGEAGLTNRKFMPAENDATHWHVYSMIFTKDLILFEIDGETIYRVTRPMVEFFGEWVFDNQKFLILNFALGGVFPYKTNGINSPYYGIPQATVEAIQRDEIKLLVDWVKVTITK
ncbi:glycoside hydrolase family 16 protein [Ornatilinea apprima]|nr:glycoside hydrolase family 16 protein [Ornatilinea apprima]